MGMEELKVERRGGKEWKGKMGEGEKEEEERHFQKISALETKLPNTLKLRKGLIFRIDFNGRYTVLFLDVITQELCLISCINEGAPYV